MRGVRRRFRTVPAMSTLETIAPAPAASLHPYLVLVCTVCGTADQDTSGRCRRCGGLVEASYPRTPGAFPPVRNSIDTYWELLPVSERASARLEVPRTPTVVLAEIGGIPIWAKVEGTLPTGSTKDRLVAVSLPLLLERGVERFVFSSTGNTAAAYAHGLAAYPELSGRVFVSEDVPADVLGPPNPHLEVVRVRGDYVEAGRRSRRDIRPDEVPEGGFFNLGRREGAKLAYLEAYDDVAAQGGRVDTVVQAVASGLGIVAAARAGSQSPAVRSWGRMPRLFCAQQASCSPMVKAYRSMLLGIHERRPETDPSGVASAILLGDPFAGFDFVVKAVVESGGGFVDVSAAEIRAALEAHCGQVPLGMSAAVALASAYRMYEQGKLEGSEGVLVVLTGGPGR